MADGSIIIDTNLNNKDLENQLSKLSSSIDKGIKGALVSIGAITTAILGIGTASLKFGTEYKKASNQLQTETGATAEEMKTLDEAMKNTYANNFGEDIQDVANTIAELRKQVGVKWSAEAFQEMAQDAIALRDTFEYDVSESIRSANTMMKTFGIDGSDAFNLIAQGAQKGLDFSGELLDNINEYSVQFNKLGLDAEDMFNIFESGSKAGAFNLDKIGDAVKEFSIRAIDGSNTTIEGFTKLGLNADIMAKKFANGGDTAKEAFYQVIQKISEMDNKVDQSIVGVDLFGTMWEDLGPEVVTQLGSIRDSYDLTADTMNQINQIKYDDLGSAIQGIGRQIQTNLLLPIGDKLLPVFNNLANKMQEAFSSDELQSSIDKIAESIGTLITKVADFAEKWLPKIIDLLSWVISNAPAILSILIGITTALKTIQIVQKIVQVISMLKKAKEVITGVSGAFKILNLLFATNPFVLIIGAVIGLVVALVTLWNTNEDFRNAVIKIWNTIKNAFALVINAIVGFFTETIPNAINNFIAFWKGFAQGFMSVITNAWNAIVTFFTEGIPNFINSVIQWFQELPYKIGYFIGEILGNIMQFGINVWNWVTTELPKIIQEIIRWFAELPSNIWNWLVNVINDIGKWGQEMLSKATTAVSNMINAVIDWFAKLPGNIWNWLTNTISNIINWGKDMANKGAQAAQDLFNNIINTIKELPGKMLDIGKNIVKGIWDGITGMASWIGGKISGFFSGLVDGAKKSLGIHSPSRVFRDKIGKFMALGVGDGFEDNLSNVYKKMKASINFETQKLSTNLSTTANIGKTLNANITLKSSDIYMDNVKVGRAVTPTISKTLRKAGAY